MILYYTDEEVSLSYIPIDKDFIPLQTLTPLSLVVITCTACYNIKNSMRFAQTQYIYFDKQH
jgi:hypothetical protein